MASDIIEHLAHGRKAQQIADELESRFKVQILTWESGSFHEQVLWQIPRRLSKLYYAIAAAHGVLGALAELLYILLVAGTDVLPQSGRFARWKVWMRIELALWWTGLTTGIATYLIWYLPQARP